MSVAEETVVRNRALQAEWYGEPLGERVRPLLERLGLSQSGLAGVLGLSPPMLSQLMSGQRAKISNPAVLHRLLAVEELAAAPEYDALPAAEVKERLRRIRAESPTTTSGLRLGAAGRSAAERSAAADRAPRADDRSPRAGEAGATGRVSAGSPARVLQALLREVASAAEIEDAARLIEAGHPGLAEVLRVYGAGRTGDAEAHLERTLGRHGG